MRDVLSFPKGLAFTSYPSELDVLKGQMQCVILPNGQVVDSERGVPTLMAAPPVRALLPVETTESAISLMDAWGVFSEQPTYFATKDVLLPGAQNLLSSVQSVIDRSVAIIDEAAVLVKARDFDAARKLLEPVKGQKVLKGEQSSFLGKKFLGVGVGVQPVNDQIFEKLSRASALQESVSGPLDRKKLSSLRKNISYALRNEGKSYARLSSNRLITSRKYLKNIDRLERILLVLPVGFSLVDWANAETDEELDKAARDFWRATAKATGNYISGQAISTTSSYLVVVLAPLVGGTLAVVGIGAVALATGIAVGVYTDSFVDRYLPKLEFQAPP